MKRAVFFLATLGALAAAPAQAVRPGYSYAEAAYLNSEVQGGALEAQGPRVGLSISLARALYFIGEYDQQQFDNSDNKLSASSFGFGLHSLRSNFQVFLAGTYERLDFNDNDAILDERDEGFGAQLGFRLPASFLELGGDAKYFQLGPSGEDEDDFRYRGTLQMRFKKNVAAIGTYETFDRAGVDQWTAGLRVYFETGHDRPRKKKRPPSAEPGGDPR